MAGISELEIFTNPTDLLVVVSPHKDTKKYGIAICRGPGHNYKFLLTTDTFPFKTVEEAIETVKKTLEKIRKSAQDELESKDSLIASIFNPSGEKVDQSRVLNESHISWIVTELREKKEADTSKMS